MTFMLRQYSHVVSPTNVRFRRLHEQAYRSYLLAYSSHSLKNIYDVHELDLQAVAKAFGFGVPPRVRAKVEKDDIEVTRHAG